MSNRACSNTPSVTVRPLWRRAIHASSLRIASMVAGVWKRVYSSIRSTPCGKISLLKHHRLIAGNDHPVFDDQPQRFAQYRFFDFLAGAYHIFHGVAVVYRPYVLGNDGALVEITGYEMGCGTNQFHSPLVRLFIRAGPDECG